LGRSQRLAPREPANRKLDPKVAAELFHRYYDEWQLADELGLDIMLNEHHATATCMSAACVIGLSVLARITKRARLLVLGYPIANRPDPLRAAEELATIDVISRGRFGDGLRARCAAGSADRQSQSGVPVGSLLGSARFHHEGADQP
jgi:alkanesulfonate monooxygenase SsuD/methylene tetrahydromethanopterin reductase-like flavin-dependent oxidoreductase (luciferase family)